MSSEPAKRLFYLNRKIRENMGNDSTRVLHQNKISEIGFCPVSNSRLLMQEAGVDFELAVANTSVIMSRIEHAFFVPLIEGSGAAREALLIRPDDDMVQILSIARVYPFNLSMGEPCVECGMTSRCCYECPWCGSPCEEVLSPIKDHLMSGIEVRVINGR